MIPTDYAICADPQGYRLCRSCRRNLDNHDQVSTPPHQASVAPDNREGCRHWDAHWQPLAPESRL